MSQSRQNMVRQWASEGPTISKKVQDLEIGWQNLARQYANLPLQTRRDLNLSYPTQRLYCAALFQHINSVPRMVTDPVLFNTPPQMETIPNEDQGEYCPYSQNWYKPLYEARQMMRHFENVDSSFIDIPKLETLISKAQTTYQAAKEMLGLISTNAHIGGWRGCDRSTINGWSLVVDELGGEESIDGAVWVFRDRSQKNTHNDTVVKDWQGTAFRVWKKFEVPLPQELL